MPCWLQNVRASHKAHRQLDGQVVQVNEALADDPELLYYDPYEGGWMVKIKMSDCKQLEGLLYADEYKKFLEEDESE